MKKYFACLLLITSSFSCKKYLNEQQVSGVSYEFYDTEKGIEALVWASYAPLRTMVSTQTGINLSNLGTDIFTYTRVSSGNEFHLYTSDINSTNGNFQFLWDNFYKGINSCNIAINRLPKVEGTNFLKNEQGRLRREGEVRFLRAFYYFRLVQTFGKIPLMLTENLTVKNDLKRSAVADIYTAIINDLKFASDNLPVTQSEFGRVTQPAAQHLLAKVYLTRGSAVNDQRGQKATDMDSAAFYAEKVIATKGALLPNYDDARNPLNEGNKEVLFAIQFTQNVLANSPGNTSHLYYVCQYDNISGGGVLRDVPNGRSFVRGMPTNYFFSLFNRKIDSRIYKAYKTVWIGNTSDNAKIQKWTAAAAPSPALVGQPKFKSGDTALVFTFENESTQLNIDKKPYVWFPRNKWTDRFFPHYRYQLDPTRLGPNDDIGRLDFTLLWLAETYLIAGEAYGRKGDYNKAAEFINMVRRRAAYKQGEMKTFHYVMVDGGNPADVTNSTESAMEITAADINSPTKIRDFILEERARELSGDYERWYDLVRTETFVDRIKMYNTLAAANVKPVHQLRPIPQTHIDRLANPGTATEEQNPGY